MVRWPALFEEQVNGASRSAATTVDARPTLRASQGGKVNGRMEVIDVLSPHYGDPVPLVVDDAEASRPCGRRKAGHSGWSEWT